MSGTQAGLPASAPERYGETSTKLNANLAPGPVVELKDGRRSIQVVIATDIRPDRTARKALKRFLWPACGPQNAGGGATGLLLVLQLLVR